jgi:hypothetical protein
VNRTPEYVTILTFCARFPDVPVPPFITSTVTFGAVGSDSHTCLLFRSVYGEEAFSFSELC